MNALKKYPLTEGEVRASLELTSMEVVDENENIRYTTYGVRVMDESGNVLFNALDIDTRMEYVEQFARLCVDNDVSILHLPDVLEDYMM